MSIRTDLASEAYKLFNGTKPDGVITESKQINESITVERVTITDEKTALELDKKKGKYISVCAEYAVNRERAHHNALARTVAVELRSILPKQRELTLVVGLGNRKMTPDALGPRTVDKLMITRHLFEIMPEMVDKRLAGVCALAPGVMAATGMESADIISAVVQKIHPDCIIAVDSLAAAEPERITDTIQLCNTGINPGAGIGNLRYGINTQTVGVPVIAIGIPVVVYVSRLIEAHGCRQNSSIGDMVVTPRTIDAIIEDCSGIIAQGINTALHKGVSRQEIEDFMY